MWSIFSGAIIISLLHGLIPSHWLPVVALGKKLGWSRNKVLLVTFNAGIAHTLSTIIIGIISAYVGHMMSASFATFSAIIPASILIILGIWFIYRHYRHHHFHLEMHSRNTANPIIPILLAMFLSPCMEIEGFFFSLGIYGWQWILLLSVIYFVLTIFSLLIWVSIAWKGLQKIKAHRWEHSSGIITGVALILSGIVLYFS